MRKKRNKRPTRPVRTACHQPSRASLDQLQESIGDLPYSALSEQLLDFAEPLWVDMPEDSTLEDIDTMLAIPVAVWNSVLLEDVGEHSGVLEEIRTLMTQEQPMLAAALFDWLVERKRCYFADDTRLIVEYEVYQDLDDSVGVRVLGLALPQSQSAQEAAQAHLPGPW